MVEELIVSPFLSKKDRYQNLLLQLEALIRGEQDFIANVANLMAGLKQGMGFFWVGVYFVKGNQLVLGPFQGPVACTRIDRDKGVCGKAWEQRETIIVKDVAEFPGHIACSSLSEIAIPGFNAKGEVFMVLDVDSEKLADFDETDKTYLLQVVEWIEKITW